MAHKTVAGLALLGATAFASPGFSAHFTCPRTGGGFVFGQEANVNSLDQMASTTISTRNIAMNIYETLMTRDETNQPIPDLADAVEESPDHMTYTFRLRPGVHFQNGKQMTSADVIASFDRYAKVGLERSILANAERWDAPDQDTFVIHMKQVQLTFLTRLSSFGVPIVIIPSEDKDVPAMQLKPVGTGPYELVQSVPGSFVKLKRFDGYTPNQHFEQRTGFGGYKQACFDTVSFRIVTEPGARVAGIQTGELQGAEDIPAKSAAALAQNRNITLLPLPNWWIQIALPNTAAAPTNNLDFRRAVQAALDMNQIMQAATDGNYRLNVGFQYPTQADYTDTGKGTYNLHDPKLAKQYLEKSGYKGEPVVLLTDKDYTPMYNSAVVMQQQLQAIGIDAQLRVTDWPTSVQINEHEDGGWNFFFTGWGTGTALGPLAAMAQFVPPEPAYHPGKNGTLDPEVQKLWNEMNTLPSEEQRHQAFVALQKYALEQVYAVPFGSLTQIEAVRADVKGFVPFRIPRMYNVWFEK